MKQEYLAQLKARLNDYVMTESEIEDIINDYDQMYEDGLSKGLSDKEVIAYLGTIPKVVRELTENVALKEERRSKNNNKWVAVMPFVSLILFFALGFGWNLWHPGWMVFLLIPVVAILANVRQNAIQLLTALSPFIATTSFLLLGFYYNMWNPGWLVFWIIPIIGVWNDSNKWKAFGFTIAALVSMGIYLYVGMVYGDYLLGALGFIVVCVYGIFMSNFKLFDFKNSWQVSLTVLLSIVIYLLFGFLFQTWAYMWMVFLFIPIVAILSHAHAKDQLVAIMPFISTILFFSLGFFFGWWSFSWLAFLLIPVVAILKNA